MQTLCSNSTEINLPVLPVYTLTNVFSTQICIAREYLHRVRTHSSLPVDIVKSCTLPDQITHVQKSNRTDNFLVGDSNQIVSPFSQTHISNLDQAMFWVTEGSYGCYSTCFNFHFSLQTDLFRRWVKAVRIFSSWNKTLRAVNDPCTELSTFPDEFRRRLAREQVIPRCLPSSAFHP